MGMIALMIVKLNTFVELEVSADPGGPMGSRAPYDLYFLYCEMHHVNLCVWLDGFGFAF